MLKAKKHIKITKHILLMWLVVFALSPCITKEALFSVVNAEYTKPLNKTKTTAQARSCQYSLSDIQQISIVKQSKIKKQTDPVRIFTNPFDVVRSIGKISYYSKTFSGTSPPSYILNKRLKLNVT